MPDRFSFTSTDEAILERLARIERTLDVLMARLFEPVSGADAPYSRGLRRRGVVLANADTARRARAGRAAKRYGFSFSDWVVVFGEAERLPPEVDAWALAKIRERVQQGDVRPWREYQ